MGEQGGIALGLGWGGIGGGNALRWVGFGGVPFNSYRDFSSLVHVADFFGRVLGCGSLFPE